MGFWFSQYWMYWIFRSLDLLSKELLHIGVIASFTRLSQAFC